MGVRCWNCHGRCDYNAGRMPEEKRMAWLDSGFGASLPSMARLPRVGRVSLLVATPVAAAMLLLYNSFDIGLVDRLTAPLFGAGPVCRWF